MWKEVTCDLATAKDGIQFSDGVSPELREIAWFCGHL
ncbi:hypothetical protein FOXB_15548 [Fusarium oxysporum f. sp. conglutinans Fo5176]|uniref:Uncharacterized protein n=1 Tax=Fusarium oxysporum (strain Fo5176) TaxID=660025 RepID=F9GA66_FUSOF|nr:hypothetical protein FOXB_15548 [Fusarium oxysporum f. sp. conglutinans Fo5176]